MIVCRELEKIAEFYGASIVDYDFASSIRYVYHNGVIGINKNIVDVATRRCIIAFGIGRHLMHNNKSISFNEEQSNMVALHCAVSLLMPFDVLVEAGKLGLRTANDLSEFLGVTPDFVRTGVEFYKNAYGVRILYQDWIIDLENRIVIPMKKVG